MLWTMLVPLGCGRAEAPPSPAPSVEAPPTVAEAVASRDAQALPVSPAAIDAAYVGAPDALVDARYFGGRSWASTRDEVERQMGAVVSEAVTSGGDQELTLARGAVRLRKDRIQMI